jgi:hypothetical protein
MFVIGKQKFEYKNRLKKEASRIIFTIEDAFIALGGDLDLKGTISAKKIQQILTGEFELNEDLEVTLLIYQEIT